MCRLLAVLSKIRLFQGFFYRHVIQCLAETAKTCKRGAVFSFPYMTYIPKIRGKIDIYLTWKTKKRYCALLGTATYLKFDK